MNSACARAVLGLVLILAGSTVAGAADKKEPAPRTEAVLLDHAEYLCKNCLFGNSDYYFCFDVNSKILIGHEKIRTQMRKKAPENLLETRGNKVPIRFDDKYIWIPGPNGKEQRLTQDYTKKLFTFSDACQRAAK
ncbi:MAG: hypothetical protein QOJ99_2097 [Bryobacterales bacterium]|jgi:hypothetical protein|nr:hypothetical protein [Bryobacterales bacterium]